MNNVINEKMLKAKLNIDNWRQLSKDKFIAFYSSIPNLDPEIAKKIVDQFPNFKDLATHLIGELKETINSGFDHLDAAGKRTFEINKKALDVLGEEIKRPGITVKEKLEIADKISKIASDANKALDKHKEFAEKALFTTASVSVLFLLAGITVLGGGSSLNVNDILKRLPHKNS